MMTEERVSMLEGELEACRKTCREYHARAVQAEGDLNQAKKTVDFWVKRCMILEKAGFKYKEEA